MAVVVNPLVTVPAHAAYTDQPLQCSSLSEQQSISQHLQLVYHILQQRAVQVRADAEPTGYDSAVCNIDRETSRRVHVHVIHDAGGQPHATLPVLQLSTSQCVARCNALQLLQEYIEQGQYPLARSTDVEAGADLLPHRLPVFIDRVSGVHCAVGQLMAATGHSTLR